MQIVKWVKQEDSRGCGIACLAMILGRTYAECAAMYPDIDAQIRGLYIEDVLSDFGFALAKKYRFRRDRGPDGKRLTRDVWPPEPFADVHLCLVTVSETSPCNHWVLMLAGGDVLDPTTPDRKRLQDYHDVLYVAAVVQFAITAEG